MFIDGVRQVPMDHVRVELNDQSRTSKANPTWDETPDVEMLSRVDPSDVEMIEVFRGASEIPGVFHWNGCAVVAIWTRWNR